MLWFKFGFSLKWFKNFQTSLFFIFFVSDYHDLEQKPKQKYNLQVLALP